VSRFLFRLRPEEAIALVFLLPTTYLTLAAHEYAKQAGIIGDRYSGGVYRLAVAILVLVVLWLALRLWPRAAWPRGLREILPFLTCILIYTNLHDTIGFVNPHDIHDRLVAIDQWLFGVQPCVWAERFITPGRTEVMTFFYMNFFWMAPSTPLILLAQRRFREFRAATMGVMTCFYLGYVMYVVFPAAPPRLVLLRQFTKDLYGYRRFFAELSAEAFSLLPVDSRAAFPSLHSAISVVALIYAWRYARVWFYLLLPFAVGLGVSTIYLRHHYAIDLIVGWGLAFVAVAVAPRLDGWWAKRQRALGFTPARGAPQE
jgi:membrane-associated phospholipid phosphatase